jgi:LuxR family maltose regulon positive regulatory protein
MSLVERVRTDDRQVVAVTAPAGYGKSTFLRQWAEREERPVAWVSLESTDDDETVVLDYIAAALERIGSLGPTPPAGATHARGALRTAALTRLAAAIWSAGRPVVLMIDDVDQLRSPGSIDALSWLSEHLPPAARLAVASRARAPLPLARLRAHGRLLEVGSSDLAISLDGARELLEQVGVEVAEPQVIEITRRAEGWPAGIYMTGLSLRAGGITHVGPPSGHVGVGDRVGEEPDNRFVAEYLRAELLDRLAPTLLDFLVRTAPLTRFDARMCDHVLDITGSGEILAELERSNAFLVPLDSRSEHFRYHHLFRQLLVAELRRRHPDDEAVIQHRAAEWCAAHGDPDGAVEYAHLAGDDDLVASVLVAHAFPVYRAGRLATLDRWFGWFAPDQLARSPRLATLGAFIFALSGRTSRSERWEDAVRPHLDELDPPTRASYAVLRSITGRLDLEEQVAETRIAMDGVLASDDFRATAFLAGGVHQLMLGDTEAADMLMARAVELGMDGGGIPATITALAFRAHIALLAEDWGHAQELVRRARVLVSEHRLEAYATSAAAYAVDARLAIHAGATSTAQSDIAQVQRIRPTLSAAIPYLSARVRLDLAHAYLALGEVAGARLMLSEVGDLLAARPGIAPLGAELATLRTRSGAMGTGRPGVASLTTAELRLLGYLPSHLSFREIAERLFVSINTVKSQAIAIYSKLGVSSRGAAIEAAVTTGLLDPSATRLPTSAPELDLGRIAGSGRGQAD